MTTTPERIGREKKKFKIYCNGAIYFADSYAQYFNQLCIWPEYVIHKRSFCTIVIFFLFSLHYLSFSVFFPRFFRLDVPFSHVCQPFHSVIVEMQRKKNVIRNYIVNDE